MEINIYKIGYKKVKSYEFSQKGLQQLKYDEIKRKSGIIGNCIFYGVIGGLVIGGVIGVNGIITMVVGMATNKSVKWLCRKGII